MKTRSNPSHAATAIINARVHAMEGVIEPGVVLVVGELIAAVGEGESVVLPTNARLIDAQRGSITPGLIDLARFERENDRPEAEGVTAYVRAVPVHGSSGLRDAARAAANLHR
ncbi:MAG: hypothetical protein GXP42_03375, partial [Chloroflexi bacterium]|nr:hypothetical protein [Chloroflexota bacterium]